MYPGLQIDKHGYGCTCDFLVFFCCDFPIMDYDVVFPEAR